MMIYSICIVQLKASSLRNEQINIFHPYLRSLSRQVLQFVHVLGVVGVTEHLLMRRRSRAIDRLECASVRRMPAQRSITCSQQLNVTGYHVQYGSHKIQAHSTMPH